MHHIIFILKNNAIINIFVSIVSHFTTVCIEHHEDVGYNALQVNYKLLTGTLDPYEVKYQLLYGDLLTLDDLVEIQDAQKIGRKYACEKMIALLLKSWKRGGLDKFLQVLDHCGYNECALKLQGNTCNTPLWQALFFL